MLMPAQLPDILMIAGLFEVEIRNKSEIRCPGDAPIHVVAAPFDFRARLDGDSHYREAMCEYPLRERLHLVGNYRGIGQRQFADTRVPRQRRTPCQ